MVIAIIAIIAAMLLPVLNKAKVRAQTAYCMNNFKQLQLCYAMYCHDNNDYLPPNGGAAGTGAVSSWSGQSAAQADTNTDYIRKGLFFQYNQQVGIYVCPANTKLIKVTGFATPPLKPGELVPQVRTCTIDYSLNEITYNGGSQPADQQGIWIRWKMDQLAGVFPGIAQKIVFVDDNEDQVSGGAFGIYGEGDTTHAGNPQTGSPTGTWWNVPGSRHNNGCVFSFMDGHVESWPRRGHPTYGGGGANPADALSTKYDLPRIMACEFQYDSQPQ